MQQFKSMNSELENKIKEFKKRQDKRKESESAKPEKIIIDESRLEEDISELRFQATEQDKILQETLARFKPGYDLLALLMNIGKNGFIVEEFKHDGGTHTQTLTVKFKRLK